MRGSITKASGNRVSKTATENGGDLTQTEAHLYGSSRLGIYTLSRKVEHRVINTDGKYTFERGNKFFELNNHLGNVLVTISDRKVQVASTSNPSLIEYYTADVKSATDYAPFGAGLPGRSFSAGGYRYGFNGKENDKDISEGGQDYGLRIYDVRLGRFLSRDPLYKDYPELTPYQFASNTPIRAIDLDGGEMKDALDHGWGPESSRKEDINRRLSRRDGNEWIMLPAAIVTGAAVGTLITVPAAVTTTVTYLGRIYIGYEVISAFEHNRAPTPEGRAEQDRRAKEHLTNAFMAFGTEKIISVFAKVTVAGGKAVYKAFKSTSIRFSQTSVNGLDDIVTSMKQNGWKGDPIDIVKMEDNIYTTVDNTRLLAAQKAGVDVKAVAHSFSDEISEEMAKRFIGKDGTLPKTWGEAVKNRIQNQSKTFSTANENGSFVQPKEGTGQVTATGG